MGIEPMLSLSQSEVQTSTLIAPLWHPARDSNPDQQFWRLVCCHYTSEIHLAEGTGFEPVIPISKTGALGL